MILRAWQTEFFENLALDEKNRSLQIYENSILGGKISSLRVTFSAVVVLIGKPAFDCIATSYLSQHPDSPVDIGCLGVGFAAYLQRHDIIAELPYIADLAKLEWHRHQVFESKEGAFLVLEYEYAVDGIWICCQREYSGDFEVNVSKKPTKIRLIRRGLSVVMRTIPSI